ncbi:MAG: PilZ domain-containing protein [Thermodesulfobacteriota bacterium]
MDREFEFEYPGQDNPRKAYRVHVTGLKAAFQGQEGLWQVKDLSAVGLGVYIAPGNLGLSLGQETQVSLFRYGELMLQELPARVTRQDEEITAFEFLGLDRRQEYELDKLVLEIQKEMIDRKKQGREKD